MPAIRADLDCDRTTIETLVDAAFRAREREEQGWSTSDHDRLLAAFSELEGSGIVAREGFGGSIAEAESAVWTEAERIAAEGARVRGTCTFNRQDAESAASDGVLFLSYASFRMPIAGEEASRPDLVFADRVRAMKPMKSDATFAADDEIGAEIVAALERQGLHVGWQRGTGARIAVRTPDWRVRLFTGDRRGD